MSKVTPFLMFSAQLDEALTFYRTLFPDLELRGRSRDGADGPVRSAEFSMGGQDFKAFEGGPDFQFSPAISLFVDCADQTEVDRFWNLISDAGGAPVQCGWITDPFGLSWQIVPRRFVELIGDSDPRKVQAVVDAMMQMQKLEVAALERAYAQA